MTTGEPVPIPRSKIVLITGFAALLFAAGVCGAAQGARPAREPGRNRAVKSDGSVQLTGIVEWVGPNSIKVSGKYYDISKAVLTNASGKKVDPGKIEMGSRIDLRTQGDRVRHGLVHPRLMVE